MRRLVGMDVIEVLPGLRMLVLPVGAAYLWSDGRELTLVDSGAVGTEERVAALVESVPGGELARIVLTHWHEDHTGGAAALAARYGGVPVVAHRVEAPVIRGEVAGAPPVLEEFERPIRASVPALPPAPPCPVDVEVVDGDVLPFGGGARVVGVPGHTDGSLALHLPGPDLLFTGDAVANVGRAMLGVFNTDRVRAVASLHRLAGLGAANAVFGHGAPLVGDAAAALRAAAADC
ncbi:glyoxylase-like metal-dependent hydrolase (beta-lactamase superfamily II) [Kitasatospora cineracea]|uniref:Glyoxylase-like metal-dependent hydrolase (Beta-lactamase superfamily II) n=2 Tax=Kitasatospora cineracea TaxID=88074 RepID=A0A3N4SJY9_9ACTN|nr:glyoxylase-like metal-dependent hydrolase (beta-lactamase superfamily II) [Kitasatospora cineracea]